MICQVILTDDDWAALLHRLWHSDLLGRGLCAACVDSRRVEGELRNQLSAQTPNISKEER